MNEKSTCVEPILTPLADHTTVYRVLLRKTWINQHTGTIDPRAYFLRKLKDTDGLSVNIAHLCSPQQCADRFDSSFGVASLNVGKIRGIGLWVMAGRGDHALIKGLPYQEDDPAEARRLARLLAEQSLVVWTPPH